MTAILRCFVPPRLGGDLALINKMRIVPKQIEQAAALNQGGTSIAHPIRAPPEAQSLAF
jgi:hypothetical protein